MVDGRWVRFGPFVVRSSSHTFTNKDFSFHHRRFFNALFMCRIPNATMIYGKFLIELAWTARTY